MLKSPLVSVVLTSYNQLPQLNRAFNSIINQTYKNIEIIIVDDCSTDGESKEYIHELAEKHPEQVRYFFQPSNVGIPRNKNTGFKLAKGDFITYLDGDDYYYPNKIENEIKAFNRNSTLDVVYSNFNFVSEKDEILNVWNSDNENIHEGKILNHVISRNFPHNTLFRFELMRSEVLRKIGYYDENIPAFHDWDSRIRYSEFSNIGYSECLGSAYIMDKQGISKITHRIKLLLEMRRVYMKNRNILKKNVLKEEFKSIDDAFLSENRHQILSNISFRKMPFLYIKARLKFKAL